MKHIVIHPGFLEGHRHFQRLISALEAAGLTAEIHRCQQETAHASPNLEISHSGGALCRQFKASNAPKLIIAPPISRHRIKRTLVFKLIGDISWALKHRELSFWFYKTFWSIAAFFDIHTWLAMARSMKVYDLDLDELLDTSHIRIIANTQDPFVQSLCDDKRCIQLDGHHDDLLYRPDEYLKHIQELTKVR